MSKGMFHHSNIAICFFFIGCILLLSHCGFHLQTDNYHSTLSRCGIFLTVDEHDSELENRVREAFNTFKIKLAPSLAKAIFILQIEKEAFTKRLSLVSSGKTTRQYALNYRLTFRFNTGLGQTLIKTRNVTIKRPLTVNNNGILGSNQEEAILKNEMRIDAIHRLLQTLKYSEVLSDAPSCQSNH